jgi:hypothetical protein
MVVRLDLERDRLAVAEVSPGPWRTPSPLDGSRLSSGAECL